MLGVNDSVTLANRILDSLDVAAAKALDLTSQLDISADDIIIQNTEAVYQCKWFADQIDHHLGV